METIQWHSSLSIGLDDVDEQHKKLVAMLNDLMACKINGSKRADLGKILNELYRYTYHHFRYEEERFANAKNYADAAEHRRIHKEFRNQVEETIRGFKLQQSQINVNQLIVTLHDWLINHIKSVDAEMGKAVLESEKGGFFKKLFGK